MLTVEDLLQQALPKGTSVLAGEDGLGAEITWSAALRSRAPGFEGIKGGELAIVSLRTLHQLDDRLPLARLIEQIAGLGVAAVAVAGPVDAESVATAMRLGLPLLQLPEEASTRELEAKVTRVIVERRAELQRLGQDFYHQMLELVVGGRGTEALLGKLAEITGRPAFLEDTAHNVLLMRVPPTSEIDQRQLLALLASRRAQDAPRLQSLANSVSDPPTIRLPLPLPGIARIVAPVGGPVGREGYLSIVGPSAELRPVDRLAVSRAAAACAIDLARDRSAGSESDHRLTELLDDLVAGGYPSEASLVGRALRLGVDITKLHYAIAFRPLGADGLPATRAAERVLRRELARRSAPLAIRVDPSEAIALLSTESGQDGPRSLIAAMREGLSGMGGRLAASVTRPAAGARGLREALTIARRALDLAVRRDGADAVVVLTELGVDELLIALGSQPVLGAFRDEWLGKLSGYDSRNGTQLVGTLEAYFESHNSPTGAAERLHLHRNTLLYRLQRIREISGRDPDDPSSHLAFHLALRIGALAMENV